MFTGLGSSARPQRVGSPSVPSSRQGQRRGMNCSPRTDCLSLDRDKDHLPGLPALSHLLRLICSAGYTSSLLRFLPAFPFLFTSPINLQALKHLSYLHFKLECARCTMKAFSVLALTAGQLFFPGSARWLLEPPRRLSAPPRCPASSRCFSARRPFPASDESGPPDPLKAGSDVSPPLSASVRVPHLSLSTTHRTNVFSLHLPCFTVVCE